MKHNYSKKYLFFVFIFVITNLQLFAQVNQVVRILDIQTQKPIENIDVLFVNAPKSVSNENGIAVIESKINKIGDFLLIKYIGNSKYDFYSKDKNCIGKLTRFSNDTINLFVIEKEKYNQKYNELFKVFFDDYYNFYSSNVKSHVDSLQKYPLALHSTYEVLGSNIYSNLSGMRNITNFIINNIFLFNPKNIEESYKEILLGNNQRAFSIIENKIDLKLPNDNLDNLDDIYYYLQILNIDNDYLSKIDLTPYYNKLIESNYMGLEPYCDYMYYLIDKKEYEEFNKVYDNAIDKYYDPSIDYKFKRLREQLYINPKGKENDAVKTAELIIEDLNERNKTSDFIYKDIIAYQYDFLSKVYLNLNDTTKSIQAKEKCIDTYKEYNDFDTIYKNYYLSTLCSDLIYLYSQKKTDENKINDLYNQVIKYTDLANSEGKYEFEYFVIWTDYVLSQEKKDINILAKLKSIAEKYAKLYPVYFQKELYRIDLAYALEEFKNDNNNEKLKENLDEVQKILDTLNKVLPNVYLDQYVVLNKYRKSIAYDMKDDESRIAYSKNIIELCQNNMKYDSINYSYDLADNSISCAEYYYSKGDFDISKNYYVIGEKALEILSKYDNKYLYRLGSHYNSMGDAYLQLKQYDKAIETYSKAIDLKDKINEDQKKYYDKEIGNSYFFIGDAKKAQKEFKESLKFFDKANKLFDKALLLDTTIYLSLGELEISKAISYYSLDKKEKAKESLQKSISYFEKGVKGFIFRKYITALSMLNEIYKGENDLSNYIKTKEKLFDVYKEYSKYDSDYDSEVISNANDLAKIYSKLDNPKISYNYYLISYSKLKEKENKGEDVKSQYLSVLYLLAEKEINLDLADSAIAHLKESLIINEKSFKDTAIVIYQNNNKEIYKKLSIAYCIKGDNSEEIYPYQDAEKNIIKAIEALESNSKADDASDSYSMSYLQFLRAQINYNLEQYLQAEECYKKSISLLISLMKEHKDYVEGDLFKYNIFLGKLYLNKLEYISKAKEQFVQSNIYYEQMSDKNKNIYLEEYLDSIDGLLDILIDNEKSKDQVEIDKLLSIKKKVSKQIEKKNKK